MIVRSFRIKSCEKRVVQNVMAITIAKKQGIRAFMMFLIIVANDQRYTVLFGMGQESTPLGMTK